MRTKFDGSSWRETSEVYYEPSVAEASYPQIEADIVSTFSEAVQCTLRASGGTLISAISGGMDSRCIVAALRASDADVPLVSHCVRQGHDILIASRVAAQLNVPHHVYGIETTKLFQNGEEKLVRLANGMATFDNLHAPQVYEFYRTHGDWMLDGNHTSIEGRWFLRNTAGRIRTRDDMFRQVRTVLSAASLLQWVRDPDVHQRRADEILWELIPDPAEYASPGIAADLFNIRHILPQHATDLAHLQNHYIRYASPYFDRRYVDVISRLPENDRWKQRSQYLTIKMLAPDMLSIPRCYSDILSYATDNPWLLRVPVALERGYRKIRLSRFPSLFRRLSRYSPSVMYSLDVDFDQLITRARDSVFDADRLREAHNTTGVSDSALFRILPILSPYAPWSER